MILQFNTNIIYLLHINHPLPQMSLILTPEKMTFEHHEKIKHVKLTNLTKINGQNRPIMFKIKTNKIDLVDAKPSCGYISGKAGNNEISVAIRWLNTTGDHSAKLQILYVANDRITEEMVEKNYAHFDNDEYNQNYQAIKNTNQGDVMTTILPVVRKLAQPPQPAPLPDPQPSNSHSDIFLSGRQDISGSKVGGKVINPPSAIKPASQNVPPKQQSGVSKTKFVLFIIAAFLVGLLAGFSLGKGNLKQFNLISSFLSSPREAKSVAETEAQEVAQTSENEEEATTGSEESAESERKVEDLNQFVSQEENTNENQPSSEETQTEPEAPTESTPSREEILANTVEQTL